MWFSSKQRVESVAVIDIGSASVGGALVHMPVSKPPVTVYTVRVALGEHDAAEQEVSMLRHVLPWVLLAGSVAAVAAASDPPVYPERTTNLLILRDNQGPILRLLGLQQKPPSGGAPGSPNPANSP